jgi:hypothetical protein
MGKLYLTIDKECLLKNYPKMTLKELCDNKIIQDKPFIEQTGKPTNQKKMNEIENQLKQIEIQIKLGIKQKAINSNYGTLLIESIRNIKPKKDE